MSNVTTTPKTETFTTIFVDNNEIKFFVCNAKGRIVSNGDTESGINAWDGAIIDLVNVDIDLEPKICFNARDNKKIGLAPTWATLNYVVTDITTEEVEK